MNGSATVSKFPSRPINPLFYYWFITILYSSVGEQISHPLLLSLNPCLSFNPLQFQCLLWFLSYCQCQWFSRFGSMVTICLTRWQNLILSHFLEDCVDEIVLLVMFNISFFLFFSCWVLSFLVESMHEYDATTRKIL